MAFWKETKISGCYHFQVGPRFQDKRGTFLKPLHLDFLKQNGVLFECRESFISFSHLDVLRGMHFQAPPHAHDKVVSCVEGEIFDVVLDLRMSSKTYGQTVTFELSGANNESVFIPAGCAHGFKVVSQAGAWMAYYTSKEFHAESDRGVLWSSLQLKWPGGDPIVSDRDKCFPEYLNIMDFK